MSPPRKSCENVMLPCCGVSPGPKSCTPHPEPNCSKSSADSPPMSPGTGLVVTPMPGDIGGLSAELFEQFGSGWGVQLLGPGETPQHGSITFSQLFLGGLIVGIRPEVLLTGFNLGGYGECGQACRDFGLDGALSASASRPSE